MSLLILCLMTISDIFAQNKNVTSTVIPNKNHVGPYIMTDTIRKIDAPFCMPQLQRLQFPNRRVIVKMKKSGLSTQNIQDAIDKLADIGGGTVVIPCGRWKTGRIILKSNINLEIQEGAELKFSGSIKDYLPAVFTRDEGIEIYSLGAFIYACNAENIGVTGKGRIIGPSTDCEIFRINKDKALNIEIVVNDKPLEERIYDGIQNAEVFLPKTIAPINCKNVLIEGVTLDRGLYWNIVPQYCENVIIRGVTVTSFGHGRTDGIDVESSRNVLIEYCSLDCQDDCYTIKSGRGKDGVKVGRPSENIVIRYCIANRGAGGIVCGTEIAGGVRNVYMHDCVFDGTDRGIRIKSTRGRGGVVEDIRVSNIIMSNIKREAVVLNLKYSKMPVEPMSERTPLFRDISISGLTAVGVKTPVKIVGLEEAPVTDIILRDINVKNAREKCIFENCERIRLTDVIVNGKEVRLEE